MTLSLKTMQMCLKCHLDTRRTLRVCLCATSFKLPSPNEANIIIALRFVHGNLVFLDLNMWVCFL